MTLIQIIDKAFTALKMQVSKPDLLTYLDIFQKLAFKQDLEAFKYIDNYLTVYYSLSVNAFTTNPVAGDIGRTVIQGSAQGTLISYDITGKKLVVNKTTATDFADGQNWTISGGTGAGSFAASSAQSLYRGPYSVPTTPPVRKYLGLTKLTDRQILGIDPILPSTDYGYVRDTGDPRGSFVAGKVDPIAMTFTFPADPDPTANTYRHVYFREGPTLAGDTDDANFLIPARYHMTSVVPGLVKIANHPTFEEALAFSLIEPYLKDYWEDMRQAYAPMSGEADKTQISEGQP